jgi:hypothetical protein
LTSGADVVRRVQLAMQAAGVEFLDHGRQKAERLNRLDPPRERRHDDGLPAIFADDLEVGT